MKAVNEPCRAHLLSASCRWPEHLATRRGGNDAPCIPVLPEFLGHLRQVNAIVVSSFAGPEYTIWGYDAARDQALDAQAPVLTVQRHDGTVIPVKPLQPLLEAGDALLGAYPCWPGP